MRETNRAKEAFEDYFNLGSGRSLRKLIGEYRLQDVHRPPTKRFETLATWSKEHRWQDRVTQRNAEIAQVQFEAIKSRALEAGYAFWPKRVSDLVALAELLYSEILDEQKRWLADVRQIGSGENAERIDLVRFNAPLIDQYRKALDDVAAEMGERVKGLALSGPDGGPIAFDLGATARDTLLGRLLSPTSPEDEGSPTKEADE